MARTYNVQMVTPGSFEPTRHFYEKVLNAQAHPLVRFFHSLNRTQLVERYCHLHPEVQQDAVVEALEFECRYFHWGGTDLLHTTDEDGVRHMVVVETNSCPSGQKSMPILDDADESTRYRKVLERSFLPLLKRRGLPLGELAVIYDKNVMETSGYAAALADLTGESIALVPWHDNDPDPPCRMDDNGVLHFRDAEGVWRPIRAAFKYVTQRPWNRIPPITKTAILNPVLICLAGGRNKLLAAKAYDFYNAEIEPTGLHIHTPETIRDIAQREVPFWVQRMGGYAVVKVPYSNAGQGVYTITSEAELDAFMQMEFQYERFIVQALVGNLGWSSRASTGRLYHVGTVPNRRNQIYVADVRFMVGNGPNGFYPVGMYARRTRTPLTRELTGTENSWDMLGTNLSIKNDDGTWASDTDRLLLTDVRDFNRLGLGLDEIIESYIQTILAVTAIDRMAGKLVTTKNRFRRRMFLSVNPDQEMANEIRKREKVTV